MLNGIMGIDRKLFLVLSVTTFITATFTLQFILVNYLFFCLYVCLFMLYINIESHSEKCL